MIPVPVAYENGYKLTPGSMSAVCCVIPTIVDEVTGSIRLGMTYNEIYATMKQRPCFVTLESDEGGLSTYQITAAYFDSENEVYVVVESAHTFSAEEPTEFPVYAAESDDENGPH